jgi:thioesterase domain-containing protein
VTVAALLDELRHRDVRVWADGDLLRCSAPPGVLTVELRAQLQSRKSEILEFLRSAKALMQEPRAIVPLQPHGARTPVFATAGHNGDVFCYRALVRYLADDQPFFGLQPPGLDGQTQPLTRVEDLAAYFASQIREFRPVGPHVLAGYCAGGTLAFELARQLARDGAEIKFVALFHSPYPSSYRRVRQLRHRVAQQVEWVSMHARALAARSYAEGRSYISEKLRARKAAREAERLATPDPVLALRAKVETATLQAIRRYRPRPFPGRLVMLLASRDSLRYRADLQRWRSLAEEMEIYCGPDGCVGDQMLLEPYVAANAELFQRSCDSADADRARPMGQAKPIELTATGA